MGQFLSGFGFLSGASYPFRLVGLLRSYPRLLSYIIVPVLLNLVLATAIDISLLLFGWQASQGIIQSSIEQVNTLLTNLPSWLGGLDYLIIGLGFLLRILFSLLLLIITGFILVQFGVILGAPWYGKLSEQLEIIRTGKVESIEVGFFREIGRAILFELKKLVVMIGVGVFLFLLNFIPGTGTLVSTLGGISLTATIICLDFFDSALERRRLKFREKLGIIRKSLPGSAGFALVCLFLVSIPLLNLITIPFCVGGGTLFVCDRILPKGLLPNYPI